MAVPVMRGRRSDAAHRSNADRDSYRELDASRTRATVSSRRRRCLHDEGNALAKQRRLDDSVEFESLRSSQRLVTRSRADVESLCVMLATTSVDARSSSSRARSYGARCHRPTTAVQRSHRLRTFRSRRRRRTTRHRPHPRHAGRQDRAEPADERDAGGDGAGALQVVVRGLRPRPRQGRRPRPRPAQAPRRPLPGFASRTRSWARFRRGGRWAATRCDRTPQRSVEWTHAPSAADCYDPAL